jgi:hypothetical protein
VIAMAQTLAAATGGMQFSSSTSANDIAYAIVDLVLSACAGFGDCNANGVLDECDLAAHPGWDFNGDGILDACQEGIAGLDPSLIPLSGKRLFQNHPNPFNPQTILTFHLPAAQRVRLSVYALDGRYVRTLLDDDLPSGTHDITWDGRDGRDRFVPSGVYFYRLTAGSYSETKQMMLVR